MRARRPSADHISTNSPSSIVVAPFPICEDGGVETGAGGETGAGIVVGVGDGGRERVF